MNMKQPITYPDFDKLDIRVGTIVACSAPEWSKKLLRFEVDFGEEVGKRVIFSGIKEWYTPDDFVSKQFPFLINLEPKKMGPEESQGMMMMIDTTDKDGSQMAKPMLFAIPSQIVPGSIVR
jgi:methionyl-tRNA synthetase